MTEPSDRDEQASGRDPAEGVRIIPADEAQAALDAGQAEGRRSEERLRYGDVPPAPSGPRPSHRFPLPATTDPASAVSLPPPAPSTPPDDQPASRYSSRPTDSGAPGDTPAWDDPVSRVGESVAGERATAETPAWTPTQQVFLPEEHGGSGSPAASGSARSDPPAAPAAPATPAGPAPWSPGSAPWDQPAGPATPAAPATPAGPAPWSPVVQAVQQAPLSSSGNTWGSTGAGRAPDAQSLSTTASPSTDTAPRDEGITMSGGSGTDLPHWTDPPTGEVPRSLSSEPESQEDLAAWQALGSRNTRWRDGAEDWNELDELGDLGGEDSRMGTLDQSRTEHSDLYSFDDAFDRLEEERSGSHLAAGAGQPAESSEGAPGTEATPERISTSVRRTGTSRSTGRRGPGRAPRPHRPTERSPGEGAGDTGRDLVAAAAVGVGLVVLLIIAYLIGSKALVVLAAAVILACAVEAYGMLQRSGFRPATLLGLVATVGVMFAAYYRGIGALPLVAALMFGATMLWYLLGIVEARPLANVAVTTMTFLWIGLLGSFAAVMLRLPHGKGLFLGAVLTTVAADIVAFFAGSRLGSRPLAPDVSPGKTVEGLIAGAVAALIVGAIVGRTITPWGGVRHGLLLGLVVAIVAPIGDLFESMIKRDLSVKDSGTILPGHGGMLDRFDSLLLVLPAAFYLAYLFNVAV